DTPRSPEVEDDRLAAANRREVDASLSVQPRQVERRRDRMLPFRERAGDALAVSVHDAPHEEREECGDEGDGEDLRAEPQPAAHQPAMMKTVVPIWTWL